MSHRGPIFRAGSHHNSLLQEATRMYESQGTHIQGRNPPQFPVAKGHKNVWVTGDPYSRRKATTIPSPEATIMYGQAGHHYFSNFSLNIKKMIVHIPQNCVSTETLEYCAPNPEVWIQYWTPPSQGVLKVIIFFQVKKCAGQRNYVFWLRLG